MTKKSELVTSGSGAFGSLFIELFHSFSYSAEEVANISGVSKQTVRRWLRGDGEPHDRIMNIVLDAMLCNGKDIVEVKW